MAAPEPPRNQRVDTTFDLVLSAVLTLCGSPRIRPERRQFPSMGYTRMGYLKQKTPGQKLDLG